MFFLKIFYNFIIGNNKIIIFNKKKLNKILVFIIKLIIFIKVWVRKII